MTEQARAEWLAQRRTGIGGSDVAAILGLSKYRSPLDVYKDKIGETPDGEQSQAAYWGTKLEDVVAREFQERTGLKVQRVNRQLSREGWMHANIDRAVVNHAISGTVRIQGEAKQAETGRLLTTDAILECKTASSFIADQWGPSQEAEIVAGKAVVGKVNVDDCPDLAERFGIMTIPAVYVFKSGAVVEKMIGLRQKPQFAAALDKNL